MADYLQCEATRKRKIRENESRAKRLARDRESNIIKVEQQKLQKNVKNDWIVSRVDNHGS